MICFVVDSSCRPRWLLYIKTVFHRDGAAI